MASVLLVASLQAFFLAVLLATKREQTLSDRVLAVWLALLGGHTLTSHLHASGVVLPPLLVSLAAGFTFVQGPLLYAYVDTLTRRHPRLRSDYLLHLVPLGGYLAWVMALARAGSGPAATVEERHVFSLPGPLIAWLLFGVPAYVAWSLVRIRRMRRELERTLSSVQHIDLGWLRFLVLALGSVWTVVLGTFLAGRIAGGRHAAAPMHLVFVAIALFVYALGFFGFRQRAVFGGVPAAGPPPEGPLGTSPPVAPPLAAKYARSGLSEEQAAELHRRLLGLMDAERPYLDERLTLQDLAQRLRVSPNHLSQVVNTAQGRSFFAFVNQYRVREVEKRLRDPASRDASLLDVALACGFASKSVFNRIFKEVTGLTPSRYRQQAQRGEDEAKPPVAGAS